MVERFALVFFWLFSKISLRLNHAIGGLIGWLHWQSSWRTREHCLINLEICFPNKDFAWRYKIARQSTIEMGKAITEAPYFWTLPKQRIQSLAHYADEQTEQMVKKHLISNNGLITACPHIGSWEFAGLNVASHKQMTSLYAPIKNKKIDSLIKRSRASTGAKLAPTTAGGIRQIKSRLLAGEVIGILPDQVQRKKSGQIYAPLFGYKIDTMTLLSKLARESNSEVIFGLAKRLPKGRGFAIHAIHANASIRSVEDVQAATSMNQYIEKIIQIAPEQYAWNYNRFAALSEKDHLIYPRKSWSKKRWEAYKKQRGPLDLERLKNFIDAKTQASEPPAE